MRRPTLAGAAAYAALLAATAFLGLWPVWNHNAYTQNLMLLAFLIGVMAVGWNIISGFAGYVSLGQSAFVGIGAYTVGILARHLGWSPWYLVPLGGVSAALIAVVLGVVVMHTRGHSFVILTIAFLFIMQLLATNWTSLTGGSNGLSLPLAYYPRKWINTPFYWAMLILLVLSVLMAWLIRRTKFGMGLIAIREDEDKAGAVGISTPVYKLLAFAASAVFVGMAGGVYGYYLSYIDPRGMFDILFSVQCVLAALLGGRATILGPVLGAGIIEFVNEESNVHVGGQMHMVVFGALMAATVLFLPRGIVPSLEHLVAWWRARRAEVAPAVEPDLAGVGPHEPVDQVEGGRLPRPVGSDQRSDRPLCDREREIVDGPYAAEALLEPLHLEQRAGG